MSHENFAGNIIVNLANLPDFLRRPILKKRMIEFFDLPEIEQNEVIHNALDAGPTIPFPNFAKLFSTWLEILATLTEEQRRGLFFAYISTVASYPQKLVEFNLDGILEIYLNLKEEERDIISQTIREIIDELDDDKVRVLMLIITDDAKKLLGL